ncbi:MAG: chromate transporter [Azospirillaceae bacterium]|nr:chromate transporter [Azospirillaceae bacterium]
MNRLGPLALSMALLSLVAVGGANVVIPDMHRQFVGVYGWLGDADFARLFAIAQAAPGPNVLIVSLIGWHVAGWRGALVATLGMCGPSGVLCYVMTRVWHRGGETWWRRRVQQALGPITVGLIAASGLTLAEAGDHDLVAGVITAVTAVMVATTRVNPLWLLGAGGLVGALGWVSGG